MSIKKYSTYQVDLIVVFLLSILFMVVFLVVPGGLMQSIFGLPFALILPGYAFLAALFPSPKHSELPHRLAISCVLSLTFITILSMGLNSLGYLSSHILIATIFIFTLSSCIIAVYRRSNWFIREHGIEDQISQPLNTRVYSIIPGSIAVIAIFLAVLGIFINLNSLERAPSATTAFYLLGDSGKTGDYPLQIVAEKPFPITIGIRNNEDEHSTYLVQVQINNQESFPLTTMPLSSGETWENTFSLTIEQLEGTQALVSILLFKDHHDEIYRSLHFTTQIGEKFIED